jgi:hypothetical protein
MIDFTTIPIYEPLPEVKVLKFNNSILEDENKVLKRIIVLIIVGILIFGLYQRNKVIQRNDK